MGHIITVRYTYFMTGWHQIVKIPKEFEKVVPNNWVEIATTLIPQAS